MWTLVCIEEYCDDDYGMSYCSKWGLEEAEFRRRIPNVQRGLR
jgi:hypothetical protein